MMSPQTEKTLTTSLMLGLETGKVVATTVLELQQGASSVGGGSSAILLTFVPSRLISSSEEWLRTAEAT